MQPSFNLNRPPVSDEEINKHKDFDSLVAQFKKQSLKKARGDESWWKNLPGREAGKKVQYSTVILGVTVVCTITYLSIRKAPANLKVSNDKITTNASNKKSTATPGPASSARYVQPRIAGLDKKAVSYRVNNQRGADIKHPSATRIVIPKSSFVDKDGKEIIGDISIEYREFDNLCDIVGSGIPMRHDSAGRFFQLESAGMFEIKGNMNGEPVYLDPAKPITVELASNNAENRFHQYYLDTVSRNWRYTGPDRIMPAAAPKNEATSLKENTKKLASLEREVKIVIPRKKDSLATRYESLINNTKTPQPPVAPKKQTKGRPVFNFEASLEDFPELRPFSNVLFEAGPENKTYSKDVHDITWTGVKITEGPVKGKNYILHLSAGNRTENIIIYPVIPEDKYAEAMEIHGERLAEYNRLVEKKEAKEKTLLAEYRARQAKLAEELAKKEADLEKVRANLREAREKSQLSDQRFSELSSAAKATRLFQVARFGIYNSDCPHPMERAEKIIPGFVDSKNGIVKPEAVYLVDHTINTVVASGPADPALSVMQGNEYSICLIERGRIFTCDKSAFRSARSEKKNVFTVIEKKEAGESLDDLRRALEL